MIQEKIMITLWMAKPYLVAHPRKQSPRRKWYAHCTTLQVQFLTLVQYCIASAEDSQRSWGYGNMTMTRVSAVRWETLEYDLNASFYCWVDSARYPQFSSDEADYPRAYAKIAVRKTIKLVVASPNLNL